MKVINYPAKLPKGQKTLVLGAFSGFHNGHLKLIEAAKKLKKPVVVLMLEGIEMLPNKESQYNTQEIRLQQLANSGVDYVVVSQFKDVILEPGQKFLDSLIKETGATQFVGGKDFAMGKGRDLKIQDIPNATIVPYAKIGDKKISTRVLKELVEVGDVKLIRSLAPYYYQMRTHVASDQTMTQKLQEIPHPGIYAAWMEFNDIRYAALVHIDMKRKMTIDVPDFQAKNANYDPVISFVEMTRKIYKLNHDKVEEDDKLAVNAKLVRSNLYL